MQRDGFKTRFGILAATLGSAVGLGNIWKFPYMTGENGGASFLLVYLLSTFLVGLPIMISELVLGRTAKANAITTYYQLPKKNKNFWSLIGIGGVAAAFLILAFYTDVAGWVYAYVYKTITANILSTNPEETSKTFGSLISTPLTSLFWQWLVLGVVGLIITMGASKGIERTTKKLMPLLFLFLVIIVVRSLTLPKAKEGLLFLFSPDFSKINAQVVLLAMGLAFFKLSIGMGTMTTYGSYFRDDANIPATATKVMLADLSVSLLAGLAIFPAVFTYGYEPQAGPSLLFITIPAIFASLPGGRIFMLLFFLLASFAATGAMLSLLEVPVAYFCESKKMSRTKATLLSIAILVALGATATLSFNVLKDVKFFNLNFFDLYDFISSNILLPVGGLLIALFAGWTWGKEKIFTTLSNYNTLNNQKIISLYYFVLKYITPILVFIILLKGLKLF